MKPSARPPAWFIVATAVLAVILLLMAVTETSLLGHYLIDQGEFIAVIGLGFVAVSGMVLYRSGRLRASMPFALPWLLYPVVTQGDQVIDNLSINWMRLLTHILLALIFAAPAIVTAVGLRHAASSPGAQRVFRSRWVRWVPGLVALADGRGREGVGLLVASVFVVEFLAAYVTLGLLMVAALVVMTWGALMYASSPAAPVAAAAPGGAERRAAVWLAIGLVVSAGLYVGYKNRPGAYQGSPSYLLDPAQQAAGYDLARLPTATTSPDAVDVETGQGVERYLAERIAALDRLVDGYYIAERNYTWDFHNELFMRSWPLLPEYRRVALDAVAEARRMAADAVDVPGGLAPGHPLAAWLREVDAYLQFNFDRAAVLERMTGKFEQTKAGLQHAAHLYEGEGKLVGLGLRDIEAKHAALLQSPVVAPLVRDSLRLSQAVYARYANRIVGF
jgi:hypothetical protein